MQSEVHFCFLVVDLVLQQNHQEVPKNGESNAPKK